MADIGEVGQFQNYNFKGATAKIVLPLVKGQFQNYDFKGCSIRDVFDHYDIICLKTKLLKYVPNWSGLGFTGVAINNDSFLTETLGGQINGTVYTDESKTVVVANHPVMLIHRISLKVIDIVRTDENGDYLFENLIPAVANYCVLSFDPNNTYNAVRYDRLTPGV